MNNLQEHLRIIFAPLHGITTAIFRTRFAAHFSGIDSFIAPFISTTRGNRATLRHFHDIHPEKNLPVKIVPQLIGNSPEDFLSAEARIRELGYSAVNWNLGCPSPTVVRKRRGSGLLHHPQDIEKFLDYVVARMSCSLSVKVRLGLENPDEIFTLIEIFNRYPLSQIIIHPRTGAQMYNGSIDLDRYGRCLQSSVHPVVYNGDITTVEDFASLRMRFPQTSEWMIGRGLLANPFLAAEIKNMVLPAIPAHRIELFHNDLYASYKKELYGPAPVLGKMKELWFYLIKGFRNAEKSLKKIKKSAGFAAYERAVNELFATCGNTYKAQYQHLNSSIP